MFHKTIPIMVNEDLFILLLTNRKRNKNMEIDMPVTVEVKRFHT